MREFAKALELAQHTPGVSETGGAASQTTARISTSFIPESPPRAPLRTNGANGGQRPGSGLAAGMRGQASEDEQGAVGDMVIHGS